MYRFREKHLTISDNSNVTAPLNTCFQKCLAAHTYFSRSQLDKSPKTWEVVGRVWVRGERVPYHPGGDSVECRLPKCSFTRHRDKQYIVGYSQVLCQNEGILLLFKWTVRKLGTPSLGVLGRIEIGIYNFFSKSFHESRRNSWNKLRNFTKTFISSFRLEK